MDKLARVQSKIVETRSAVVGGMPSAPSTFTTHPIGACFPSSSPGFLLSSSSPMFTGVLSL